MGCFCEQCPPSRAPQTVRYSIVAAAQRPADVQAQQLWSRRQLHQGLLLAAASAAAWPAPAEAKKVITRSDGEVLEAFEFDVGLRVVALSGSVPAEWETDFRQAAKGSARLSMDRRTQLRAIYDELLEPGKKKSAGRADAVTLSDTYLAPAIQRGLLQPLQRPEEQAWWDSLSPRWRSLVRRDEQGHPSAGGHVWGVPYRWGCTLIAFRSDKISQTKGLRPVRDWEDLLQPGLRGRVAIIDSPREYMGVALKTLGLPFNASKRDMAACGVTVEQLRQRLQQLHSQVRLVSSREHTKALSAGDVWAVVGHSSDLVPLMQRSGNITAVVPASGSALWSDLWVVPRAAQGGAEKRGPSPLLPAWLLFGLEPSRASRRKGLQGGASPLLLPGARKQRQSGVSHAESEGGVLGPDMGHLMPDAAVLERSEFLLPWDSEMAELYWQLMQPA